MSGVIKAIGKGGFLCCLLISAVFVSTANAASTVWQVSSGNQILYLAGTIHLLRSADYPLPEEFDSVYKRADKLVFETDMALLADPVTQRRMQQAVTYQDGTTLQQKVSAPIYAKVAAKWQQAGLPPLLLKFIRPGGVVMTLTMAQLRESGVDAEGIDQYFHLRANNDSKPVAGLESIDLQIGYLADMGEGNEDSFLQQTLTELEQSDQFMDQLILAWRDGDLVQLERLIIEDMRRDFPGLYHSLLVQRNLNWLPQIQTMLNDGPVELVLVGAGHLVGPDGLLQQLKSQGYIVRQVSLPNLS
ncbi:TraB/GumN family protein [Amphritea sp. HPY]|uniref:TraB/GumN family protein n=1 Tax=Amphritea sp. HPY TaxID=3421652 RepID=UPI003D7CC61A